MRQRRQALQRVFGALIALSSLVSLPPLALALWWAEPTVQAFFDALVLPLVLGLALWWPVRNVRYELRLRDGFLITALAWATASVVTAIPFMLAPPYLPFTRAVFESTSGLTTTGATMITGLEHLPRSLLFYRASLCYLGGIGIVILAVAILPMLRIGGMQLFRAESTGPQKENKLTPRIAETARALWYIYTGLTTACALAYWIAGMNLFDALTHAMTTVATAGFANYDASFGHWDSGLIDGIAIVFMFAGGVNFGLHWYAWRRATVSQYQADIELRSFFWIAAACAALVALQAWAGGRFDDPLQALRHALFQTVSNITTTGFTSTGFADWPGLAPWLLVLVAFVGGCAGSTSGGMKVARIQMVVRTGLREIRQLVHPKGQFVVKVGGKRVSESVVISVAGFCTLYLLSFLAMTLLVAASGADLLTAITAVASCINNLGPGLGEVAAHFQSLNDFAVWVCTFAMILGRLEIFTLLVLLTPQFWQE
jgi:trk system potassium uptake protein TrkH